MWRVCLDTFVAVWSLYLIVGFTNKWQKLPCEILRGGRLWYIIAAGVVRNIHLFHIMGSHSSVTEDSGVLWYGTVTGRVIPDIST